MAEETLVGNTFGKLTVLSKTDNRSSNRQILWLCECICGNHVEVRTDSLTRGDKYSCGCLRKNKTDLTGSTFGKLTVLREVPKEERTREKNRREWLCQCSCGNTTTVKTTELKKGTDTSCGCDFKNQQVIIGNTYNMLTVIKELEERAHNQILWDCVCECGNHKKVRSNALVSGVIKSCGCLVSRDIIGTRYGMLTVIEKTTKRFSRQVIWNCLCDCGNYKEVPTNSLTRGNTKSCGCLSDSSGELAVREYLVSHNVPYASEYMFEDLHTEGESRLLRFDFAVLNQDGTVKLLIEYDGKQHSHPIKYYGGEETLQGIIARDALKNSYCADNGLLLVRIPYTSYFEIEEILDNVLKDYIL